MSGVIEVRHVIGGRLVRFGRAVVAQPPGASLRVLNASASITPGTAPTPFSYGPVGSYKPDATTTGVPTGTALTTHIGNMIPGSGVTLENLDIYGRVIIQNPNVTIRKCRIRGTSTECAPLVQAYGSTVTNALIEDCTLIPDYPLSGASSSAAGGSDAVTGHDYTVRRCHVTKTIDGFGIFNTSNPGGPVNVVIEQNYVHDLTFISPDPGHTDNKTHNDCVQIQGGSGITIRGNNFVGSLDQTSSQFGTFAPTTFSNSAMQVGQNVGAISGLLFDHNWVDGGAASLNIYNVYANLGSITNNRFGRNQRLQGQGGDTTYTILYNGQSVVTIAGNVYDDNDAPILVRSNGS